MYIVTYDIIRICKALKMFEIKQKTKRELKRKETIFDLNLFAMFIKIEGCMNKN